MVKITDIAEYCGVSIATVSYVLNGKGKEHRISIATQEKVLAAAQQLGYDMENRLISTTGKNSTRKITTKGTITMLWPVDTLEMIISPFLIGFNQSVSSNSDDINLVIKTFTPGRIHEQKWLWESAPRYNVAVIIGTLENDNQYLEANPTLLPAVLANREIPGYPSVTIDHTSVALLAARHALSNEDSSIGLIIDPFSVYGLGYKASFIIRHLEEHGIDIRSNLFTASGTIDGGYELGRNLIMEGSFPKMLICMSDVVGFGLIAAFSEAGIAVGSDTRVISISSGPAQLFARSYPSMTVVDMKSEKIARLAFQMALDIIGTSEPLSKTFKIQPEIVYRRSSPLGASEMDDYLAH